ncbi:MAG: hypothetical protein A2Y73_05470 [Chloroflexi bacterium RBG_13_56_8]|nr:MAG: hypothetical protein A2Y73_05470 [Chloroflexi bacterium RBG_13_56_8]
MRILYITPYVPSRIRIRPYNFIKGLSARGHAITLFALAPGDESEYIDDIRPHCQHLEIVQHPLSRILTNCAGSLFSSTPLQAAHGRSPAMRQLIEHTLQKDDFDLIHVEHLRASEWGRWIQGVPKVYDSVDCISLLFERTIASSPQITSRFMARLELGRTRRYEGRISSEYDKVLVTSQEDKESLAELMDVDDSPKRVTVVPNGVDLDYFTPLALDRQPETLVFTGKMSYHANVASALYLCSEIMPLIWNERPNAQLWIVGKDPAAPIRALAQDYRIKVTGYVPDLRPYLAQATAAVTPIRYGVGIQNKVLEAMALATPVVTTPQACLALSAEPGRHLMAGDSPDAIAQHVLRLLADRELRDRIGASGRAYVEEHHNWLSIAASLEAVYKQVLDER